MPLEPISPYLDKDIDELDLSVRAKNCLNFAQIKKIGILITKSEEGLLSIRNFGIKSLVEIKAILERKGLSLRQDVIYSEGRLEKPIKPQGDEIQKLSNIRLEEINLSVRAYNCLKSAGIETIGMLLEKNRDDLLKIKNFGRKTLYEITAVLSDLGFSSRENNNSDNIVGKYNFFKQEIVIVEEPCSSLSECLAQIKKRIFEENNITKYLKIERNGEIFRRRYGFGREVETLESIGKGLGLTRERIRQISSKQLNILSRSLGASCRGFIRDFRKRINKDNRLIPYTGEDETIKTEEFRLFDLIISSTNDNIRFDSENKIWANKKYNFREKIREYLDIKCLPGETYSDDEIRNIAEEYVAQNLKMKLEMQFIKDIFHKYYFLPYGSDYIYKKIKLMIIFEQIIKNQFPEGVFIYKEIDKVVKAAESVGKLSLEGRNKRGLIGLILKSDNIFLWDWGKYIHKDNIKINKDDVKKINRWIKRKLNEVPKVSVWGAFRQFQDECLKNGIYNEHALYSCMKILYENEYAFMKAPYVYDKNASSNISQAESVEDFIKPFKQGIDNDKVENALGIKWYQLSQALSRSDKIVKWGDGKLIHEDNIDIDRKDLLVLRIWITDKINKFEHISVIQVFQHNLMICQRNDIKCSIALYSALRKNFNNKYSFPRYPFILSKENNIPDDGRFSMNDIARYYFEGKNGIVYQEEIYKYLVSERGYDEKIVRNLRYLCEDIVKYQEDAYISLNTINWTHNKAIQLRELAMSKYDYNCKMKILFSTPKQKLAALMSRKAQSGVPFVHVSELLEDALPELDENGKIKWTEVLLGEILDMLDGIMVLGSSKSIFVKYPNDFEIKNIEDIACYILKNEFGGKTEVNEFEKRLKQLRIPISIKNRKYDDMICDIVTRDDMVILSDSRDNKQKGIGK